MNILFYRYGSICEPDIIEGFQELGNTVYEITIEITEKNLPFEQRIQILNKALLARSYDFVFSINFYPFVSEVCNIHKLLYICWTVDCPVMDLLSYSLENKYNRIFLFDKAQYDDVYHRNPECIFHLPLATNPTRWDKVIQSATPSQITKFSSEVSFVGSLYTEKCPYDRITGASAYLTGYLEGIMDAQEKIYGGYFLEEVLPSTIVEEFKEHLPGFYTPAERFIKDDRLAMARIYLCAKISANERVHTMKALGERFSVDLYTGSNTNGIPVNNRGLAKTLTEMPLIFHNSKINLNITSKSIRTALPLRIFDVLGCGGFLLTNYQTEIPTCYTIGSDLDCYGSIDELLEKTEYYLTHEKDRIEIAMNGYETTKRYHNYPERLLELLSKAFGISNI